MKETIKVIIFLAFILNLKASAQIAELKPEILEYEPFVWKSETPEDCPFTQSEELTGIKFLGVKSSYHYGDTWYPTWAENDTLYSPWTDGETQRLDGYWDNSQSYGVPAELTYGQRTGHGVITGDDPLTMKAYSIGLYYGSHAHPYHGRYPAGSLIKDGVWYYGTYCLDPAGFAKYGHDTIDWPWMGPFVGFRTSQDYGNNWEKCPHTPDKPLFGESGRNGYPIKIGAPHFVDFGKNMEHSPDGKAYLVAHGADINDPHWKGPWNNSWCTGDQIYMIRVTPTVENINDVSKYEYYGGKDDRGNTIWGLLPLRTMLRLRNTSCALQTEVIRIQK